jgi:DNA-binding NtrC family response regulator
LKDASAKSGTNVKSIDAKAVEALEAYSWPGNVRELRNVIERAVVLAEGKAIQCADLTERVRGGGGRAQTQIDVDDNAVEETDYRERVRKFETDLIIRALHKANGNQTEAAKALNLPLRTFVHKIQTYGIKKKFDK